MSRPPLDSRRVSGWLQRLEAVAPAAPLLPEAHHSLTRLSPRKRDKHLPATNLNPAATLARHKVLSLLAHRVLQLSLTDYEEHYSYPFYIFEIPEPEWAGSDFLAVAAEIAHLKPEEVSGWALAGLQLWDGAAGQKLRKRTGSYYTPPALARRIAHQTLSGLANPQTIVDPACGGGIFLLAALDWLAEHAPVLDLAELITGRLYGLDLNPAVVDLARLALLRRAAELNDGPLSSNLLCSIATQIRPGNALIGGQGLGVGGQEVGGTGVAEASAFDQSRVKPAPTGDFPHPQPLTSDPSPNPQPLTPNPPSAARELYQEWEKRREAGRAALREALTNLPIFNAGVEDGRKLAALSPFDWRTEWPEVFGRGGFDAVLGNPPYVGFNDYSGVEKAYFAHAYPQIYNLKNDLLYYFIQRGVEVLRPGGQLGYVTARFWKEAVFAAPLRQWLARETRLHAVEDFGGTQLFKGAVVDTCLLFLEKGQPESGHSFAFEFEGRREQISQTQLDPAGQGLPWAWLRRLPPEEALVGKIREQSVLLEEIAHCRTGVQTGQDRVFFVDEATAAKLEPEALRKAIKSADILPGKLSWRGLFLIYPPADFAPATYPLLCAYLEPYYPVLRQRLRYDEPFPPYQLQWPRTPAIFEAERKLITPYKAPRNTFALDCQRYYFSTDVISVVFKTAYPLGVRLEQFAANFLNSRLSTFQFRSYSKPVGGGQYDYYANPVKKLAFPQLTLVPEPSPLLEQLAQPDLAPDEMDDLVNQLYNLNTEEIGLITKR